MSLKALMYLRNKAGKAEKLEQENQRLREALEFYLEQIESGIIKTEQFTKFVCPAPLIIDGGDKAKKALKELEK